MKYRSRRGVLGAAVSLAAATAGCQSVLPGGGTDDPEFDPTVLSASAAVVHQPTTDRPPTIELALENTGDSAWPVRPVDHNGYPMEGVLAWPDGQPYFVWIPPESDHVSLPEHPESRRDGCWRVPEDAEPAVADIRQHRTIDPGESFAVTHHVFFHGSPDGCFSPGEYEIDASFAAAETEADGPEFGVTYRLTVDEDGEFSMAADGPAGES